jgi:hypothetical protein
MDMPHELATKGRETRVKLVTAVKRKKIILPASESSEEVGDCDLQSFGDCMSTNIMQILLQQLAVLHNLIHCVVAGTCPQRGLSAILV